jgi:hypothetical protein
MTVEGSYVFEKGWYVNAGFLFNSNGVYQPIQNWEMLNLDLSPENIMPTKWNMIITGSKQLTPLFSGSLSTLYAPGTNLLIFLPSLQYNLDTNLDVSLFWQSFFAELSNHFEGTAHRCFLRMKWSF